MIVYFLCVIEQSSIYISNIVKLNLRAKQTARPSIKLTHPFHPMQSDDMHEALHHIECEHHADCDAEKSNASNIGDIGVIFGESG